MNKNVLIAFGGATLIALVVAIMLNAMLQGGSKEEVIEAAPKIEILVATKDIAVGQILTTENLKWQVWAEDAAFPGVVRRASPDQTTLDALSGRVIRPIATGEPVIKSALVKDEGGFLAAMLTPGNRAAAIKVDAETMAGGFVNPGDFVDVILTYSTKFDYESDDKVMEARVKRMISSNLQQYSSETVLQNIKVIGIDQKAVKESEDTAGKVAKTVTLEVTPQQAEILALSGQMGSLTLALRSLGDTTIANKDTPAVSDTRVSQIYKEIFSAVEKEERESGARRYNIRIYSGGEVTSVPVR